MPATFKDAPEIEFIAKRLINARHQHLVNAKIKYIFRKGPWAAKGRETLGQAQKCSGKEKYLTGYDFLILINEGAWQYLLPDQQEALVDHELLHCERDDGNYLIRGHSFEGFPEEVAWHGFWSNELLHLRKVARESGQLSLFELGRTGTEINS